MHTAAPAPSPQPLWTPSGVRRESANLSAYLRWLRATSGRPFPDYESLWGWSVADLEGFWESVWQFFDVQESEPHQRVLGRTAMPGAEWFPGARLNYVDQLLRHAVDGLPAIIFESEAYGRGELGWHELRRQAGALAQRLRECGVGPGDRVAAYLPNIPQAVVAFLATASIGAIWSVCAPDMGVASVADRFVQIEPKVLITVGGYRFGGKAFDRRPLVTDLLALLPSVGTVIAVDAPPSASGHWPIVSPTHRVLRWEEAIAGEWTLRTEPLPFDHPLWIVYSSGTTGLPKGIVHGHGGALAIGLVQAGLHWDLRPGDRYFWYSSTGWIMWNLQVMGLLAGSTICLYDGAVTGDGATPDWGCLWRFVDRHRIKLFGAGAAYYAGCLKAGIEPQQLAALESLETVGSTGSPLSPECYAWIYRAVKSDLWLLCTSGGTDIAGAFLIGSPTLPVYAGEMQCRTLGAAVAAFDDAGHEVLDAVGELVCTRLMPSMPVCFWNDEGGRRYRESYFETFRGPQGEAVWRHGDWLKLVTRPEAVGGVIYGRSDATINRQGIRFGTAELYRLIEAHPDVLDSLAIDLEFLGRPSWLGLFVVLRPGRALDEALVRELRERIRAGLSPRHVPDEVREVPAVPRTLTGKKLEVPLKKLLLGQASEAVLNPGAVANPESLDWFVGFARARAGAA